MIIMHVYEAVQSNDRRKTLEALRDSIAMQIDSCDSGRDMASLSKRLMEVISEIDGLPADDGNLTPIEAARQAVKKKK